MGHRRRTAVAVAVAAAILVAAILVGLTRGRSPGARRTSSGAERGRVAAEGLSYTPAEVRVAAGGVVTFTNRDSTVHTFTADGGLFDSGPTQPGQSFTYSFGGSRTVAFHCEVHPAMRGTVTVEPR